jgi:Uma2 family endonuclease
MSTTIEPSVEERVGAQYCGLRMTADEFLQIQDDGCFYELIDGVVVMSPSPSLEHQAVTMEVATQISLHLREHPVGRVFPETDVHLGTGPTGGDLVYRPEVMFVRSQRLGPETREKFFGAPDLVVEVISKGSRRFDTETKKRDYERFGVHEYWLIDPARNSMTFYRLEGGRFVELSPTGVTFASQAVPGFVLDVARVRETFKPW